jgi:hypothetical protein
MEVATITAIAMPIAGAFAFLAYRHYPAFVILRNVLGGIGIALLIGIFIYRLGGYHMVETLRPFFGDKYIEAREAVSALTADDWKVLVGLIVTVLYLDFLSLLPKLGVTASDEEAKARAGSE